MFEERSAVDQPHAPIIAAVVVARRMKDAAKSLLGNKPDAVIKERANVGALVR